MIPDPLPPQTRSSRAPDASTAVVAASSDLDAAATSSSASPSTRARNVANAGESMPAASDDRDRLGRSVFTHHLLGAHRARVLARPRARARASSRKKITDAVARSRTRTRSSPSSSVTRARSLHFSARRSMSTPSTACVIANASRLNFDGAIDFSSIVRACGGDADAVEIRGEDATPSADAIAAMCVGRNILITKEVLVDVEKLPRTIEMIAEAGTGYNNIDIERARELGITVTNVPSYSSDAVSQLVITFVLASSVELCEQYGALRRGDRD